MPAGGLMVAIEKVRHPPGHGIGMKGGFGAKRGGLSLFPTRKKLQNLRYNPPARSPITG